MLHVCISLTLEMYTEGEVAITIIAHFQIWLFWRVWVSPPDFAVDHRPLMSKQLMVQESVWSTQSTGIPPISSPTYIISMHAAHNYTVHLQWFCRGQHLGWDGGYDVSGSHTRLSLYPWQHWLHTVQPHHSILKPITNWSLQNWQYYIVH